jgi:hypothetical protein
MDHDNLLETLVLYDQNVDDHENHDNNESGDDDNESDEEHNDCDEPENHPRNRKVIFV